MSIIYSWIDHSYCGVQRRHYKVLSGSMPFLPSLFIEPLRAKKNRKKTALCPILADFYADWFYATVKLYNCINVRFSSHTFVKIMCMELEQFTSGFQDSLMLKRVSFICPVFVEEILSTRKKNQLIRNWSDPLINSLNLTLDRCDLRKLIRGQLHLYSINSITKSKWKDNWKLPCESYIKEIDWV